MNNWLKITSLLLLLTSCEPSPAAQNQQESVHSQGSEYDIQDINITTLDGAILSGMVARKAGSGGSQPVILQYTIYVRDQGRDLATIKEAVDRGYVGVIVYTRGKRFSSGNVLPYEHDAKDAYETIDWISKQSWCNGSIGMYGGSYNGFTQWAACKRMHPALKTIVPYVAAGPGMGWPMENNIFINPNYEWAFLVGNNPYLDTLIGNDRQRFRTMQNNWWESGAAYAKMDSIDGTPNPWFQRWISHPAYDEYWQSMVPYQEDFAQINIPVLSIDGYFNDSQNSGLYYLREHYKYRPDAEHYLIIGPYSHFGAQRGGVKEVNGYQVDENALINTNEITYQWLDYVLKGKEKPEVLKDKINFQVMGTDEWRSATSLTGMSREKLKFYLTDKPSGSFYQLQTEKPASNTFLSQTVDLADRASWYNDYYPDPIIRDEIDTSNGFVFVSEVLEEPFLVNGSFTGELAVSINKKDFDLGVTLYEQMSDGKYFHLSYIVSRASYASDRTKRQLLLPEKKTTIPLSNTHLVSRQLRSGSRLVVYVNVNKNPFAQLNYGTGKDISHETVAEAGEALIVKWYNDSYIEIPIWRN